jgi:transcriptional regulator with XRE-family HTH domain
MPSDPPSPPAQADPLDRRIAERLRARRLELGVDPSLLDAALDLRPGSVHRFEGGRRPIPASILYRLARMLDADLDAFFRDQEPVAAVPPAEPTAPDPAAAARRLLEVYRQLDDPALRERVRNLVASIAAAGNR